MIKKTDKLQQSVKKEKTALLPKVLPAIRGGRNKVYHNVVSKAITLDDGWITTLEKSLFSVENIVRNPKKFIAEEDLVVDVERAKRTTARTVRHLSSNSRYVQNVTESGDVRPRKVLTMETDEDLAIYENRFVCSLVHHVAAFVETRYGEIVSKMHAFDETGAGIISSFVFGKSECEIKMGLKVKEAPKDKVLSIQNDEKIDRIKNIRVRVKALLNTEFIKFLSTKKAVHPPIIKTNIIRLNTDYNNAYKLWLYISGYTFEGVSVKFREKNLPIEEKFYKEMTSVCAKAMRSLFADGLLNEKDYEDIPFRAITEKNYRILTAYKFYPEFSSDKKAVGEETVNEYYFKAMRDEFYKATRKNGISEEKDIALTFSRFFRSIAKINEAMYKDVIFSLVKKEKLLLGGTDIAQKNERVRIQKAFLKRFRQLSRLKCEELEKTLKCETREWLKLEKLSRELEDKRRIRKGKSEKKKSDAERAAKIREKKSATIKRAKEYEYALKEREREKIAAAEEKKRAAREAAQRRRDLKRLAELKEKYER